MLEKDLGICTNLCLEYEEHVLNQKNAGIVAEEDGTCHVINDSIWEMSIRMISTKVEGINHNKAVVR